MRPRLFATLAAMLMAGLVVGACSSHDDSSAKSTSTSTSRPSASTSRPDSSTTTATPDLNAVSIKLTRLADLERPTSMAARTGDDTVYVSEKAGRLRAIRGGRLVATPVLDITSMVGSSGNEQGFLSFAYSPDGTKLYVDYTNQDGDTRVDEYAVGADGAIDTASRRQVLAQDQPQPNHNGGQLQFGPDGFLYIGFGDGGAAGDQGPGHVAGGNGQSVGTLLGKILRINPAPSGGQAYTVPPDNPFVNRAGARPEIWSYGLRNPWRFSFDRTTGDFWIGDVGQDQWEEVDLRTKASGAGKGVNFGWNVWEGTHSYRSGDAPGAVAPVFDYSHDPGNCSVTGGYVYRGQKIPALRGVYLFADYCTGQLRALVASDGKVVQNRDLPVRAPTITSFGQDRQGELYVLSDGGGVYRVDAA